ncbi:MAG: glutamate--tRNA ligase [Peptococcaceae bacterium]|nr:glutamate--tRNA ligase [Peptococcaceae bacterium]
MKVRVRFAPSPTGLLHIGGARSALFNYLYAAGSGGGLVLRSEDTDRERSRVEYEESIADALDWLGIAWQEGLRVGGECAPYRQSERLEVYQRYVEKMAAQGYVYECFCSEEELEAERQELMARGELPRYLGRCAGLTPEEKQDKRDQGMIPSLRFQVRPGDPVVIEDQVRGEVVFDREGIGDFIIVKSDGLPTYNFAVVVDDLEMNITHVIRGEEHLSNTPRQVLIFEALDETPPQFAHISLILNDHGKKMTKRDGDTAVADYREKGYLPEALINFVGLLGWSPPGEKEILTIDELIELFSLERVSKAPAVFDKNKLDFFNAHYIRECSGERLAELIFPFIRTKLAEQEDLSQKDFLQGSFSGEGVAGGQIPSPWLIAFAETIQEKIKTLAEARDFVDVLCGPHVGDLDEEAREVLRGSAVGVVREAFRSRLEGVSELDGVRVKSILKQLGKDLGLKGKDIFMPLRVSVTGQMHGPDLDRVFALLGVENILARMGETEKYLS